MLKASYFAEAEKEQGFFVTPSGKGIFRAFSELYREDAEFELNDLKDRLSEEDLAYLTGLMEQIQPPEDDRKAFDDCLAMLEKSRRAKRIAEIGDILSMTDADTDPVYIKELTEELMSLNQLNRR